jgi:hypothetical protein
MGLDQNFNAEIRAVNLLSVELQNKAIKCNETVIALAAQEFFFT